MNSGPLHNALYLELKARLVVRYYSWDWNPQPLGPEVGWLYMMLMDSDSGQSYPTDGFCVTPDLPSRMCMRNLMLMI